MRAPPWLLGAALALAGCTCGKLPPVDPKDHAEGLYFKATADFLEGNLEEARAGFERVRTLSPADPRLPAAIGEVELARGKLEEAERQFREALLIDPKRGTNWSRLGFILAQRGKRDEARQALTRAVELGANDFNALENLGELAHRDGDTDAAVAFLTRAAAVAPDSFKPVLFLRAAQLLTDKGRTQDAIATLRAALTQGGGSAEVHAELGELLVRAGDFRGAIESYRAAAQLSPKDPTLWELVGELYASLDKPGDAELAFRESLRIADRVVVRVALAKLHLARKERDGALLELELALKAARGEDPLESAALSELLEALGRKADALKLLEVISAEEDLAEDVPLQLRTARLARELRNSALALEACERVARAKTAGARKPRCPP